MVINYLKLKLNIYTNRFKMKPKEEAYGELFGYGVIISFISLVFYLIYSKIFDKDVQAIMPMVFINFAFVTLINIGSTFNYLYKSIFEFSDREMLFILPFKKIEIIIIKYIEVISNFWIIYLLFLLPSLIGLLFIDIRTIFSSILICMSINLLGIIIVSILMMLLFFSIQISNGKNIKLTCLLISCIFGASSFIIIFFFSDILDINFDKSNMLVRIIFYPCYFIYTALINFTQILVNIQKFIIDIIISLGVFLINFAYFSKCIDRGTLLLDASYVKKVKFANYFLESRFFHKFETFILSKKLNINSICIFKKDFILISSSAEILKLFAQVTFLFTIFNMKFECDPNGIMYFVILIIKTLVLVICLSYFLIRAEKGAFYLILNSSSAPKEIILAKAATVIFLIAPFSLVFDISSAIILNQNWMVLLYESFIDINILIFLSISSMCCIYKFLTITSKMTEVNFKAGLFIFIDILSSIVPIILICIFIMNLTFTSLKFKVSKLIFLILNILLIYIFYKFRIKFMLKKTTNISHEIY